MPGRRPHCAETRPGRRTLRFRPAEPRTAKWMQAPPVLGSNWSRFAVAPAQHRPALTRAAPSHYYRPWRRRVLLRRGRLAPPWVTVGVLGASLTLRIGTEACAGAAACGCGGATVIWPALALPTIDMSGRMLTVFTFFGDGRMTPLPLGIEETIRSEAPRLSSAAHSPVSLLPARPQSALRAPVSPGRCAAGYRHCLDVDRLLFARNDLLRLAGLADTLVAHLVGRRSAGWRPEQPWSDRCPP